MKNACIFDLDGTLLDTLPTIAYYGNAALTANGFSPAPVDAYRYFVGDGAKNLVRRMLSSVGETGEDAFLSVYNHYMKHYDASPLYLTEPYAGIPETLAALKADGFSLSVLSNKPESATLPIVLHFFPNVFDSVIGSSADIRLKPAPDGVFRIAEDLHLRKENILYIGDTATDMETAKNAGVSSAGCVWGFRTREELKNSGADVLLEKPADILYYLRRDNRGTSEN